MVENTRETYNAIFSAFMALEDDLHSNNELNEFSFRNRELTEWACRVGTIIVDGDRERMVLAQTVDVMSTDGALVMNAGMDLREAAMLYLTKAKPHWGPAKPASDLAALAFGLDGETPTLKAQGDFIKLECNGDATLAAAKAKEFGTALGSLTPGRRPSSDKKSVAPAADAIRKNPWLLPNDPAAIEKRVKLISQLGTKVCDGLAKAAGKTIAGTPRRAGA